MDGTTGGTMTPPRDTDTTTDEFAPVIPLRRRQHHPDALEHEGDSGGIWDPDTPLPSLTARHPPHQPPPSGLTAPVTGHPDSANGEVSDTSPAGHGARTFHRARWRRAGVLSASGLLAIAALTVALLTTDAGHPRPTRLAPAPATLATGGAVTHAATAIRPDLRTHHTAARTTSASRARPQRRRKAPERKGKPAASTHPSLQPPTVITPSTTETARATQIASTDTPASSADQTARHAREREAAARRAAAAACVPGELGC